MPTHTMMVVVISTVFPGFPNVDPGAEANVDCRLYCSWPIVLRTIIGKRKRNRKLPQHKFGKMTTHVSISMIKLTFKTGVYASNPAFKDVVPIPQDDGPRPLAKINYSEHYAEAMSYLRALMVGEGEMSQRALQLTGDIIAMNPAHYTVWYDIESKANPGRIVQI
jgi:hypothetical protein